ncbi:MAG: DNA polymerase III subunit alpha, partial [Candidatus Omnitrophica bacterium]|nr:DNA polymerase III subunit alpha [Candidatus Omnitrophota bacterium]
TNDCHYLKQEDAEAHEALLSIQTGSHLEDPDRMRFETPEFYFKSAEEMRHLFSEIPDAIKNTVKIAEKCNLGLVFMQIHLPNYDTPAGKIKEIYLEELCREGLKKRYEKAESHVLEQLNHELKVIRDLGYTGYFLIVQDFIRFAKSKGIPVGPGRGSAAGSLVSYLLGITDIDPLKYHLLFERFLNPNRVSMPDIDIDFCYERRGEVIDYVTQKYGKENVAQIITFGTMAAKAAVRDVGRVMNMPYPDVDRIAKLIPNDLNMTLRHALEVEPQLAALHDSDPQIKKLLDISMKLEGLNRHASTHAAGVVISEKPLVNYVPLFKTSDGQITTGFPMGALEKIGLLKMDFLGLKTLTVIDETCKIIQRRRSHTIDMTQIPLEDLKAFSMLARGESLGVFQLDSSGMRDLLRRLKPERFEDIIALLALYRPGPIGSGMVDEFIKRKHGEIPIRYDHKALETILKDTYGIILYQEQAMLIASTLAGSTLSQADELRRAMSKKNPEAIQAQREAFIAGATKNGVGKKTAEKIFNLIEYFAGYGFNKSHSTAYALISYQTAYLKANYPVEFLTALLSSEMGNTDKVVLYMEEAKRIGIRILPPDVNESFGKFTTVDDQTIRFGLNAVKNVGQTAIDSIVQSRQQSKRFESLQQLCEQVDLRIVNRKVLESLMKCGACDSFGMKRSQMLAILDRVLEAAAGIQSDRSKGQFSFFDQLGAEHSFKKELCQNADIPEWPRHQLLAFEKELLGYYVTGHPLSQFEREIRYFSKATTRTLQQHADGEEIAIAGIIQKLKQTMTKRTNERMAILQLEDLEGSVEVLVFPSTFKEVYSYLIPSQAVLVKGRISLREEEAKIIASEIIQLETVKSKYTQAIHLHLRKEENQGKQLRELQEALSRYPGTIPVYLHLHLQDGRKVQLQVNADLATVPTDELMQEIEALVGTQNVVLEVK